MGSISNEALLLTVEAKNRQELSVEPVEMSTLVESAKQEAHQSLVDG